MQGRRPHQGRLTRSSEGPSDEDRVIRWEGPRRALEGVQRPPIFEADDGHEYVLKLDSLDPDFPAAELVSAHLATAFGVPQPHYAVLRVDRVLVDAMAETGDPDLVEFSDSFYRLNFACFGSRYLTGVVTKWSPRLRSRITDCDPLLARLLVFDAFIENGDRSSASNPNLLVANDRLYAIDHGQALPSVQGATGKRLRFPFDSHLAWPIVQERPFLLDPSTVELRTLTDEVITTAVRAVPSAWWTDAGRPDVVIADLRARRDALPDILLSIRERLT